MPRYFVTDPPVAVPEFDSESTISDRAPNVIFIRAKMDVQTDAAVKNELIQLGKDGQSVEIHAGANAMALLIHNIVKWSGPDLDGVPCDAQHIRSLDPNEPHIAAVLSEITTRNTRPASPKVASAGASGSESAGDRSIAMPVKGAGDRPQSLSEHLILKRRSLSDLDGDRKT